MDHNDKKLRYTLIQRSEDGEITTKTNVFKFKTCWYVTINENCVGYFWVAFRKKLGLRDF